MLLYEVWFVLWAMLDRYLRLTGQFGSPRTPITWAMSLQTALLLRPLQCVIGGAIRHSVVHMSMGHTVFKDKH